MLAFQLPPGTEPIPRYCQAFRLRSESDGLLAQFDGPFGIAELRVRAVGQVPTLHGQGKAEVAVGGGVFRVEFDGLAEALDGLRHNLSVRSPGRCRGCCRHGVFRVEFDGLAVAGDGLVQLPLAVQGQCRGCSGPAILGSSSMAFR